MKPIFDSFPVSNEEYEELETKFGNLAHYASWQLLKKNVRNNHTDDLEDITQELRLSMIRAASYYKRQVYIERCFDALGEWEYDEEGVATLVSSEYIQDPLIVRILNRLRHLWSNRTRHGANKVVYGEHQEELLESLVATYVPEAERPRKDARLVIDAKFVTYCKAIAWNAQKSMGKKITREKAVRTGMVSLSQYDYMGTKI